MLELAHDGRHHRPHRLGLLQARVPVQGRLRRVDGRVDPPQLIFDLTKLGVAGFQVRPQAVDLGLQVGHHGLRPRAEFRGLEFGERLQLAVQLGLLRGDGLGQFGPLALVEGDRSDLV